MGNFTLAETLVYGALFLLAGLFIGAPLWMWVGRREEREKCAQEVENIGDMHFEVDGAKPRASTRHERGLLQCAAKRLRRRGRP